jgi:hypothetical protein
MPTPQTAVWLPWLLSQRPALAEAWVRTWAATLTARDDPEVLSRYLDTRIAVGAAIADMMTGRDQDAPID